MKKKRTSSDSSNIITTVVQNRLFNTSINCILQVGAQRHNAAVKHNGVTMVEMLLKKTRIWGYALGSMLAPGRAGIVHITSIPD